MSPNQTNHSTNYQNSRPDNVSNLNNSTDSGTNINKYYNKYSRVNIDKDSNTDNKTDIALNGNINNRNSIKKGGNKYNGVDIGNNASINSGKDINKDGGARNNFGYNTYKLVFKGIKS